MMDERITRLERELHADPGNWETRKRLAEVLRHSVMYNRANRLFLGREGQEKLRSMELPEMDENWRAIERQPFYQRRPSASFPFEFMYNHDPARKDNRLSISLALGREIYYAQLQLEIMPELINFGNVNFPDPATQGHAFSDTISASAFPYSWRWWQDLDVKEIQRFVDYLHNHIYLPGEE